MASFVLTNQKEKDAKAKEIANYLKNRPPPPKKQEQPVYEQSNEPSEIEIPEAEPLD